MSAALLVSSTEAKTTGDLPAILFSLAHPVYSGELDTTSEQLSRMILHALTE